MLRALVNYYEAQKARGQMPAEDWAVTKVSGAIELDESGKILALYDLHETEVIQDKKGKEKKVTRSKLLQTPQIPVRTVNVVPGFLCDNTKYIFGFEKDKTKNFDKYFNAFKDLHLEMLSEINTPPAVALKNFLIHDENRRLTAEKKASLDTGNYVFRFKGKYLHEYPEMVQAWANKQTSRTKDVKGVCALTGQEDLIVKTHPLIMGVPGAQSSGAALVSYNSPAFESYGKENNLNAHIGRRASQKYTAALNQLLKDQQAHTQLGETTIVYWAKNADPIYQKAFAQAIDVQSQEEDLELVDAIYKAIRDKKPIDIDGIEIGQEFYILGLSANAARLFVRFFYEGTFGDLLTNLAAHNERMSIVKPKFIQEDILSPYQLLKATANEKSRDKKISPPLPGEVMTSIIQNSPYPESLYSQVILRIRMDPANFDWKKAAIIKGYLIKNKNYGGLTMSLNENNHHKPYVLGRLFSVLEFLQQDAADNSLNTTIKDKYFGSAAATPGRVFPLLIQNSANHLKKIKSDTGKYIHYDRLIGQLIDQLDGEFSKTFSLEEQGEFYIGYYQQRQRQFTKKDKENQ